MDQTDSPTPSESMTLTSSDSDNAGPSTPAIGPRGGKSHRETIERHNKRCCCPHIRGNKKWGRNLVVCIDGTSNQFSSKVSIQTLLLSITVSNFLQNTNVVELYRYLLKGDTQLTYYNSGIGP